MIETKYDDNSEEAAFALFNAAKKALEEVGLLAEGYAKLNLENNRKVVTGNLLNSITHRVQDDYVEIGTNVEYAPYIEFGTGIHAENGGRQTPWGPIWLEINGEWRLVYTRGQRPKPYLRPAVNDHLDEYRAIVAKELSNI